MRSLNSASSGEKTLAINGLHEIEVRNAQRAGSRAPELSRSGADATISIVMQSAAPFAPRPDSREACGENGDERVADLHHAHTPGHAAGRSISADWDLWWIAPEMRHCCIRVLWIGPECIAGNVEMHRLAHFPGHPKSKCTRQCISRAPEVVHRQRASEPVGPGIRELPVALYMGERSVASGHDHVRSPVFGFPTASVDVVSLRTKIQGMRVVLEATWHV